jgi:hypothetical protein
MKMNNLPTTRRLVSALMKTIALLKERRAALIAAAVMDKIKEGTAWTA